MRVQEKLAAFLTGGGYARVAVAATAPDPRLWRVVGREPRADRAPGSVARMVRAAIVSGSRVVREGEVIISVEAREHEQQLGN